MKIRWFLLPVALCVLNMPVIAQDELRTYYEQQQKELLPQFTPPALGSEVTIRLAGGKERTGILMKLSGQSLSMMTDNGMVTYNREALHEFSRAFFFAEDFAHFGALERTREYKQQLDEKKREVEEAERYAGTLSVSMKSDRDSDKEVEEEESETPNGATLTVRTVTRTETETINLNITVGNLTGGSDTFTVEWYFLGESVASDTVSIHDKGSRKITVPPRSRESFSTRSEAFIVEETSVERNSSASDHSSDPRVTETGTEFAAYVVLLKYGNEILDKEASAGTYLEDEWMSRYVQ